MHVSSRQLRYALTLGLALALAACTPDEGDPSPQPGAGGAAGAGAEGGSGGTAGAPAECEDRERRCADDIVEVCDDGQWTPLGLCSGGQICEAGVCIDPPCEPDCEGRVCGDDGCEGRCGECGDDESCSAEGQCVADGAECGDGACEAGETCENCPGDCGQCCGDGTCDADGGESCATCLADCGCGADEVCDAGQGICVPGCEPIDCAEVECGDDGCGGSCGACEGDLICEGGACVEPPAECGDGVCEEGESCLACPLDCGVCCGDGACVEDHGENCATCLADCFCGDDERCDVPTRACVDACTPTCGDRECGDDGCDGSCGECEGGDICAADGRCVEPPAECGDDVCDGARGEDCSTCPADCGQCCGDGVCAPGVGENCATCLADCACEGDELCDAEERRCVERVCEPDCNGRICGPDGCGGECGVCEGGELCDPERGRCEAQCVPQCDGRECGPDRCGGNCGACAEGDDCDPDGQCVPECVPQCDGRECGPDGCGGVCGACADGEVCSVGGVCLGGNVGCDCSDDEVCIAGICRGVDQVCAVDEPEGLCPNGQDCVGGVCVDGGVNCSPDNPAGVCPVGALCIGGECQPFDADALCDDGNPCTADVYDAARDGCVHIAADAPCSDGNGCTIDACVDGVCLGEPIGGCVAPPTIDPYVTPTNEVELRLAGDKPAGSSVVINGEVAVPESPEERWEVVINLVPGENVYRVRTRDRDVESAEVEVRVVYDIDAPTVRITPGGGVYLDGVTVTIASNEPATVFYTTDGSTPDEWSDSFFSVRTLRIFDDTTLRVRARDVAGNWQEEVRSETYEISGDGNRWLEGPELPEGRIYAAATGDGRRILVAGGTDGQASQAGTYLYVPADEAWLNLPALPIGRAQAAAAYVGGAFYLFGGEDEGLPLNFVERLNPDADEAWARRRPMPSTRFGLQAVAIGNNIHVFGGKTNGGVVLDTHEVYNTNADSWSNDVAQMPRARYAFAALRADDGDIYLVGGEDEEGRPIAEVDVFDPVSGQWAVAPALPTPRSFLGATINSNIGRITGGHEGVVVFGGRTAAGQATAVVEEYVTSTGEWRRRQPLPAPRLGMATATVRGAGELDTEDIHGWVVGGQVTLGDGPVGAAIAPSSLFYNQTFDYMRHLEELPAGRFMHAAVSLDDHIYILGGREFQETTAGWAYNPETGRATPIAELPGPQNGLAAVAFDGRLWAIGGANAFGLALPTLRSYDPATDQWQDHRPMLNGRRDAVAAVIDGEIYVVGGDNNGAVQSVEIYNPTEDRWRNGPLLPEPRSGAVSVAWRGALYVAGGRNAEGQTLGSLLRLAVGEWRVMEPAGYEVADAVAALVNGRMVIFGGRAPNGDLFDRKWIYRLDGQQADIYPFLYPNSRLLEPLDFAASAVHNGEVYIFGGNENAEPGPSGLTLVQKYAGRCLDGILGPYEGLNNFPDLGGGCGEAETTIPLPNEGYGHHGSCGSWNECRSVQGCADMACRFFGHGAAATWAQGSCTQDGRVCNLFRNGGDLDRNFRGCVLPTAVNVTCRPR